jgi:hypothetical protein
LLHPRLLSSFLLFLKRSYVLNTKLNNKPHALAQTSSLEQLRIIIGCMQGLLGHLMIFKLNKTESLGFGNTLAIHSTQVAHYSTLNNGREASTRSRLFANRFLKYLAQLLICAFYWYIVNAETRRRDEVVEKFELLGVRGFDFLTHLHVYFTHTRCLVRIRIDEAFFGQRYVPSEI